MNGHKKLIFSIFVPVFTTISLSGTGYALWYFNLPEDTNEYIKISTSVTDYSQVGHIVINSKGVPTDSSGNVEYDEYTNYEDEVNSLFLACDNSSIHFSDDLYAHYIISKSDHFGITGTLKFSLSITAITPIESITNDKIFGDYVDISCKPLNGETSSFLNKTIDNTTGITTYIGGTWYTNVSLETMHSKGYINDNGYPTLNYGFSYNMKNISCSYVAGTNLDINTSTSSTSTTSSDPYANYVNAKKVLENTDITFNFSVSLINS